jgi:hypothetical protein
MLYTNLLSRKRQGNQANHQLWIPGFALAKRRGLEPGPFQDLLAEYRQQPFPSSFNLKRFQSPRPDNSIWDE